MDLNAKKLNDFLVQVGGLKRLKRSGWVLRKVRNPESVAEHSFRLAIMAWILAGKEVNLAKVIKMSLIHDLCEVGAGDATPYDHLLDKNGQVPAEVFQKWPRGEKRASAQLVSLKHDREQKALQKITANLPIQIKDEIMRLWHEYEENFSKEGRFVRQLDRLESLFQAMEYAQTDKDFPIAPWWEQMIELIDDPKLLQFMEEIGHYFNYKSGHRSPAV